VPETVAVQVVDAPMAKDDARHDSAVEVDAFTTGNTVVPELALLFESPG